METSWHIVNKRKINKSITSTEIIRQFYSLSLDVDHVIPYVLNTQIKTIYPIANCTSANIYTPNLQSHFFLHYNFINQHKDQFLVFASKIKPFPQEFLLPHKQATEYFNTIITTLEKLLYLRLNEEMVEELKVLIEFIINSQ